MPCENTGGGYGGATYYSEWKASEREACGLRWLVLRMAEDCPAVREKFEPFFATIRADHLRHRREDRDDIVNRALQELQQIEWTEKRIRELGGEPAAASQVRKDKLKREATKFAEMTDEQLMSTKWRTIEEMA